MTLAVPPSKWGEFSDLMRRRGVEATIIGTFTKNGKCHVTYNKKTIMDIDMEFLHNVFHNDKGIEKSNRHTSTNSY